MFKMISENKKEMIMTMADMKPLDIGTILEGYYKNTIVMRSANTSHFEIINLSRPGIDSCWSSRNETQIRLLEKGSTITLEVI